MQFLLTGRFRPVFYFLSLWLLAFFSNTLFAQQEKLPIIHLQINQISLQAEVADTDKKRAYGLMHRQSLEPNSGMLFVFEKESTICFWMKNTPLPLSIAFISEQGVISNIEQMTPFNTASTCPITPIKFALEMEQGWFAKHQISAGDQVQNLPH